MRCRRCETENPAEDKFCGQCGAKLEPAMEDVAVPGEEGAFYCFRHRHEVTRVRCGRCDRPICPRCTVYGPAGVRCRDCARNRVPLRPRGLLHETTRTLGRGAQGAGRVVWYMAVWYFILSLFTGIFGGHNDS